MQVQYNLWLGALLIAGLLMVGCSKESDNPATPNYTATEDDYSDASEDAGSSVADPDEGMLDMMMGEAGGSAFSSGGESELKSGDDPTIDDTSYVRHGLTITLDRTYYAADSSAFEIYDPNTTVRIFSGHTVDGTITKPRRSADIHQSGYFNITGVTPSDAIMTFNGSVVRTVKSEFQAGWRGVHRTYNGRHQWTIVNVQIGRDRLLYPYPLSGEIQGMAEFSRVKTLPNGKVQSITVTKNYTIAFNGTQFVEIKFAGGWVFWLDLMTGWCNKEHPE